MKTGKVNDDPADDRSDSSVFVNGHDSYVLKVSPKFEYEHRNGNAMDAVQRTKTPSRREHCFLR